MRTVFCGVCEYLKKEYKFECDFGEDYKPESAIFFFEEGDGGLERNMAEFINRFYHKEIFKKKNSNIKYYNINSLDEDGDLVLTSYHIEYRE